MLFAQSLLQIEFLKTRRQNARCDERKSGIEVSNSPTNGRIFAN